MLSRSEFNAACKAYIAKRQHAWTWNEHPTWPNFGYMSRSTVHTKRGPQLAQYDEDEQVLDEATASTDMEAIICEQYVVYSATFQVPTFYFTMNSSQGAPLSLDDILCTTLLRASAFEGTENRGFGLTPPMSSIPLVSQGEHPSLGTPCWYLHPCETAKAVEELVAEKGPGADVIETWLVVVGHAVELGNATERI
ncbi:hypothetical protein APHAL10511_001796 [Amanita phalloides]|nr:hypothetical protein APHAL10511_001796 [Amanita phalloides]